jgi:hypothetical protein
MAVATQYSFDLKEVTEALIRLHGLKTGKWMLSFEFSLGGGVFGPGPGPESARPGAMMQINRLQLQVPDLTSEALPWVVDAAELK